MTAFDLVGALRHRNYRLFIAGQTVSLTGGWMQTVARAWLIYRLTGSAELLGLVAFASQLPILLLASLGGAVADRHDRYRIILATQSAAMLLAFALAGLTLAGVVSPWNVCAISAFAGIANAFEMPARHAFIAEIAGRDDLPNAIALNSTIFNGARLVGPAIAGLVLATIGEGWCFLANGLSFLAVLAAMAAMRRPPSTEPVGERRRMLDQIRDGIAFAVSHARIRATLLLVAVTSLMGMSSTVLMPLFAGRVFGGGPQTLGWLMSASGGGALAAALALAGRSRIKGLDGWIAAGAIAFGAALVLFALSPWLLPSLALLAVSGFAMMAQMGASNTVIQGLVPNEFRGRVMALYSMMFLGVAPFGSLLAGLLAERIGAAAALAFGGMACSAGGAAYGLHVARMRRLEASA